MTESYPTVAQPHQNRRLILGLSRTCDAKGAVRRTKFLENFGVTLPERNFEGENPRLSD